MPGAGFYCDVLADMPACILAVMRNPDADLVTLNEPLTIEPLGIAVGANDLHFRDLVANYVEAYRRAGRIEALRSKWMDDNSWIAALP